MNSFDRFLSHLGTIPDPRRAEGKLYQLPHVLLFSILAIVTGANSYRGIRTFIKTHRQTVEQGVQDRLEEAARPHGDPVYSAGPESGGCREGLS